MKKVNAVLVGLLFAGPGAHATETNIVLDSVCPTKPHVVLGDQASFCNPTPINMATPGSASVYPSSVNVAGLSGVISDLKVRLLNVTHSNTSTVRAVLVPPTVSSIGLTGTTFFVLSPSPPAQALPIPVATSANWTFSDQANDYALFFQNGGPVLNATAPVAGTYLPRTFTNLGLAPPAPTTLESQLLSSQIGRNPNGAWNLFVNQATFANAANPQASGTIAGGWCVDVTTTLTPSGCYNKTVLPGTININDSTQSGRINRNNIPGLCTWPKTNALFDPTPIHYDSFNFTNLSSQQVCFTLTSDFSGCGGNSTQPVVYSTFNPAMPGSNVIADPGYSTTDRLQISFKRAPGEGFTVVAHEIVANTGCPAYNLVLEQNRCNAAPVGDLIFRNGFD